MDLCLGLRQYSANIDAKSCIPAMSVSCDAVSVTLQQPRHDIRVFVKTLRRSLSPKPALQDRRRSVHANLRFHADQDQRSNTLRRSALI